MRLSVIDIDKVVGCGLCIVTNSIHAVYACAHFFVPSLQNAQFAV